MAFGFCLSLVVSVVARDIPVPISIAANPTTLIGKVIDDETKSPLEFCTVTLYTNQDSSIISGTVTSADGAFSISTGDVDFFVKIEYIAYKPNIIDIQGKKIQNGIINLQTINLTPQATLMPNIEVRAERSSVMMTLDKRVFIVGKDLTSAGGTAEDILRNVPSLSLDSDGRFNLRGNGGIRILLNGRASALVSDENLSGLRQIRASQIQRVEIITNPSARFEAEGMSGIVNIILKKNQSKGLNGSVDAHVGNNSNIGIGANINYQKNKFNGFIGIGGWHSNTPGTGEFRNRFYHANIGGSTLYSNLDRIHERAVLPICLKFGADYQFNKKNVVTSSVYLRSNKGKNNSTLNYTDAITTPENILLYTERLENETEEEYNFLYSFIYKRSFAKTGHQIVTEFQFEDQTENESSLYTEQYKDQNFVLQEKINYTQFANNEEGNRRLGLNIDYVLPLQKDGKFETGIQSTYRRIFNNYQVRNVINNIENTEIDFTNDFLYEETIHSMYINMGKKINKFSVQSGLRFEYTDATAKLLATNESNPRDYNNFFPSTFFTYSPTDNNAFQFSYSRRIERPTINDLNPFFTLRDRRNIFKGNPNIQPEYTNSFELGYLRYWQKGSLSTIAYFRETDNVIKRIQRVDSNNPEVTITQAENLDIKRNYGIELTYTYNPISKLSMMGDINIFHSLSEGTYTHEGKEIFVGGASYSMKAKTTTSYTFFNKFLTQFTFSYSAPRRTTQGINRATTALDLAGGIDVFKKNATLTLSVNDLFNSRRRRSFSEDETFYSADNFLWQSRTIILSFHYRFNQQKESNRIYVNPLNETDDEQF